ncbi:MAG: MerR family transcriptional regulator [Clostridiaceae bacterium]|nr:MerR family transcriptional regulator [Clostridiaceae bacterium]
MKEECFFTDGELARKCGVTVRTLQYYDQCGLLSPSRYSEGGRRLYDIEDVLRLQQILFFKGFGFSLEEIRDRLMTINSTQDFAKLLARQKEVIKEQIRHLEHITAIMDETIKRIESSENLSINMVMAILKAAKQNNFYARLLTISTKNTWSPF